MADASGLRNFLRYARIRGFRLSEFLSPELYRIVEQSEALNRIPASVMVDILELTSVVNRQPSMAIELADWTDRHSIGMLSVLLDACPTIGESLRVQSQYVHLETFAIDALVEASGDEVVFFHNHRVAGQFGRSQYVEAAMMVCVRLIRMSAGESWAPLRVEFEHPAPEDISIYASRFRCPVVFGAERNALYISADDLHRPLPHANPRVLAYLEQHMATLGFNLDDTVAGETGRLIAQRLASGNASLQLVADAMGLHPRSLQQRLAKEGVQFSDLLMGARKNAVDAFVRSERQPDLMRLAFRLGYSEASNASRFLRQHYGKGLRQLIKDHRSTLANS